MDSHEPPFSQTPHSLHFLYHGTHLHLHFNHPSHLLCSSQISGLCDCAFLNSNKIISFFRRFLCVFLCLLLLSYSLFLLLSLLL